MEEASNKLIPKEKEHFLKELERFKNMPLRKENKLKEEEIEILKNLGKDKNLVFIKSDEVVINKEDCMGKLKELVNDGYYVEIKEDITVKLYNQLKKDYYKVGE